MIDFENDFRMVAKIALQQEGDDEEQANLKHTVPEVKSIDINPSNPQLALVANEEAVFLVDATSAGIETRILQQYKAPTNLAIRHAIFTPFALFADHGKIYTKRDVIFAVIYENQRFITLVDPVNAIMKKILLPFVVHQLRAFTGIVKDFATLPQSFVALGKENFAIISFIDKAVFLGVNDFEISMKSFSLPVFANEKDSETVKFGDDPRILFIQHGNYIYKYQIIMTLNNKDHTAEILKMKEVISKTDLELPMSVIENGFIFERIRACQLKKIFRVNCDPILGFEISHTCQMCVVLTPKNVEIFKIRDNIIEKDVLRVFEFTGLSENLRFLPYIEQVEQPEEEKEADDFDIFAEVASSDCSMISEDIEVSSGQEFKELIQEMNDNNEIKGQFDEYLTKSKIVSNEGKTQILVNVLKEHPYLYEKFRNIFLEGENKEILIEESIENFEQDILFSEDDNYVLVRPNTFSGFCVFDIFGSSRTNALMWHPVNITSVQDFESKQCAKFVPGENIMLLGVGNVLYFSAEEKQ